MPVLDEGFIDPPFRKSRGSPGLAPRGYRRKRDAAPIGMGYHAFDHFQAVQMAKPLSPKPVKRPSSRGSGTTRTRSPQIGRPEFVPIQQVDNSALRTRDINESHVVALGESIAAIGLIQPLAVDQMNRLLAGAHRLAALRWLQGNRKARFLELFPEGIPVLRMDFNANSEADLALAIEISENEQRRDYNSSEIQRLAERLKAAGFHYNAEGGRPRTDSRPLMPTLELVVGKSARQLRRILNPENKKPITRSHDLVFELRKHLETSERLVALLSSSPAASEYFSLVAQFQRSNRLIVSLLESLGTPSSGPS
jgi:ParB family transcriptional regulator, chromosome partitioning protein